MLTLADILQQPTYIPVRWFAPSRKWYLDEAVAGQSLKDVIEDLDNVSFVVCLENGTMRDVTKEAADLWWELHGADVDYDERLPDLVAEHYASPVSGGMAAATAADFYNACKRGA
jgi:hypothetical protein